MRTEGRGGILVGVMLRMLAPAAPVNAGRLAIVRASLRLLPASLVRATWDWDDGQHDEAELGGVQLVHAQRAHRYGGPGVYRVRIQVGSDDDPLEPANVRYVTVRRSGQVAASGWVRDAETPGGVPFGFLITPGERAGDDSIVLRCLIRSEEVVASRLTWLFADDRSSLHFGGHANIGKRVGDHPFRVDVSSATAPTDRAAQQLAISLYAPGSLPGRDSPLHRVSGAIRPGRVDLGGFVRQG